jgi:trigger factor
MKLEVTELGPIKRALKIEIPSDEVNREFARAYAELNRQVQIPGFRPGKAPVALLEKRYAKVVEEDVVRRLIPTYYDQAVRQAGIVPVVVEVPPLERVKIKKDTPFSFTATVEIKPKIELRDYRPPNPISLKPEKRTVTDEQIDRALEALREQQAQLDAAPPGVVLAEGLHAIVDVDGFLDLAPIEGAKLEGHLHKVGSQASLLGIEGAQIDEALIGKKEGDFAEVTQAYPPTHPDERLAGKSVVFRIQVKSVKQKKLPALDDEFAKDCGPYKSLQELKDKILSEMERALKREVEESYKDQIIKRLVETHHFDVPETLVEREVTAIVREVVSAQRRQKKSIADLEDPAKRQELLTRLREEHLPEATRRVKIALILETIAEREGITVADQDITDEIERLAKAVRLPQEQIRQMVEAGGDDSREELKGRILTEKALDFVYRHAVIQG